MKVLITGGTGFVGSHTVAATVRAGHEVRLLVRSPERIAPALEPLGLEPPEHVAGDVTDPVAVRAALKGCDAVIHAASVYSFDPRRGEDIARTNIAGTEMVLGAAAELSLDPIVHVSSLVALLDPGRRGDTVGPDDEPGTASGAYIRSKAESDRVARRFQTDGAPVVISYPGSVWGPHDPYFGESCQIAMAALRRLYWFVPRGRVAVSDVRDVAALHTALLEPGRGPRRYLAPGRAVSVPDLVRLAGAITRRRLGGIGVPPLAVLPAARLLDRLQRLLPLDLPVRGQSTYITYLDAGWDDRRTREDLGLVPRDLDETVSDTLRWMYEAGHVSPRLAGALAASTP